MNARALIERGLRPTTRAGTLHADAQFSWPNGVTTGALFLFAAGRHQFRAKKMMVVQGAGWSIAVFIQGDSIYGVFASGDAVFERAGVGRRARTGIGRADVQMRR